MVFTKKVAMDAIEAGHQGSVYCFVVSLGFVTLFYNKGKVSGGIGAKGSI